jgi:hypothetical protein
MPHDRDGKILNVGDRINIPCNIKSITTSEELCNVTVETAQPMFPETYRTTLVLNSKQVVKVE